MTCKPLSRLYFSNGIVASCPGAPIAARAAKEIVAAIATLHTCIAADASPPAVDSRGVCLIDDLCHAQQDGLMRIRMAAALLALSGCSFDSGRPAPFVAAPTRSGPCGTTETLLPRLLGFVRDG